jgi:outer membrane protein assembly factor BamA
VTLAAPNLGGEGNLLGLVVGQPPKVTANDFKVAGRSFRDDDTSLHLEAFYRIRVDKAISITPGFIIITNPEHDLANDSLFVGTIRTTFTF